MIQTITPKRSYINLAEAVKTWDGQVHRSIWAALMAVPTTEENYRTIVAKAQLHKRLETGDRKQLARALATAMEILEGFDSERFLSHATSDQPSPRRSFVNLAEAVRTVNSPTGLRDMLIAIAGLNMTEEARQTVLTTFLANTSHTWDFSDVHRSNLASSFARLLEGQPKFDVARFIHHATSDSDADDDSEGGKWSYNHNSPEDAMKTTIEADGESVTI